MIVVLRSWIAANPYSISFLKFFSNEFASGCTEDPQDLRTDTTGKVGKADPPTLQIGFHGPDGCTDTTGRVGKILPTLQIGFHG